MAPAKPASVDLDLDLLRPEPATFRHRGDVYRIPREMQVEAVIEALQLREKFREAEGEGNEEAMVGAMTALRGIVFDLLDDAEPGQKKPRLSIEEITAVLTLAMGGAPAPEATSTAGLTPEATVSEAIVGDVDEDAEADPTTTDTGKAAAATRSRRRSPARSSS